MPSNNKASLVIPILLIAVGAGWLITSWLFADAFPPNRDFLHWTWLLGLGVAALPTMAVRRADKGSVVVGLVFLLASLLMVFRFTGQLSVDAADFLVPLPVIGIGVVALFVQVSAIGSDPLRQPINWVGCGITVGSLLLSGLGALVVVANGMMMEGRSENVELVGVVGAIGGMVLAVAGCIVALVRRPADSTR